MNNNDILIIGGGIAGLSTALALARGGHGVHVFEKSPLSGANVMKNDDALGYGLQLAPNAMRHLYEWGLGQELNEVVSWPTRLRVRHARTGKELASMQLDPDMQNRYGAPYACVHRADLQRILLHALQNQGQLSAPAASNLVSSMGASQDTVRTHTSTAIQNFSFVGEQAILENKDGVKWHGKLLIGADGIWSRTRAHSLNDASAEFTGFVAHRACFTQNAIPQRMRRYDVELWLGNRMHMVTYPVRRGTMLNVVLIAHQSVNAAQIQSGQLHFDSLQEAGSVPTSLLEHADMCKDLRDLMLAVTHQKYWRTWPLFERLPVNNTASFLPLPSRPLLLLGDAAHPMRPHLAQGAGMAIEDAALLAHALKPFSPEARIDQNVLHTFAQNRVKRVQKVQKKSFKLGKIYRATGLVGAGRNVALRLFGSALMRQHWLYKASR